MHVYIVEDDALIRGMVAEMLDGVAECHEYASAAAFLETLGTLPFGCVVLDVGLPDQSGLDVLSRVTASGPCPVVMLSGSTQVDDVIGSFRRGAVHFLRKPFSRQALLDAIAEAERVGLARKAEAERRAEAGRIRLTAREHEVLGAMTEGEQSKSIAWKLGLSVRTVDMHRSNIIAKLRARNASQAVAIARTLRLLPDAPVAG